MAIISYFAVFQPEAPRAVKKFLKFFSEIFFENFFPLVKNKEKIFQKKFREKKIKKTKIKKYFEKKVSKKKKY